MERTSDRLTITGSRGKALALVLASAAFVAVSIWLLDKTDTPWMSWLGIVFFGAGGLAMLWAVIRPQRLELDARGLRFVGLFGRGFSVPWAEIETFGVWRVPTAPGARLVAFSRRSGHSGWEGVSQALGAGDGAIPSGWPMSPERLAELLETWRLRYGDPGGPRNN